MSQNITSTPPCLLSRVGLLFPKRIQTAVLLAGPSNINPHLSRQDTVENLLLMQFSLQTVTLPLGEVYRKVVLLIFYVFRQYHNDVKSFA